MPLMQKIPTYCPVRARQVTRLDGSRKYEEAIYINNSYVCHDEANSGDVISFDHGVVYKEINEVRYRQIENETVYQRVKVLRRLLDLSDCFRVAHPGIEYDITAEILNNVVRMHSRDIDKYWRVDGVAPDIFRQIGSLASWIAKLGPLRLNSNAHKTVNPELNKIFDEYLNELFALYVALAIAHGSFLSDYENKADKTTEEALTLQYRITAINDLQQSGVFVELLSILKYRPITRHALTVILKQMITGKRCS